MVVVVGALVVEVVEESGVVPLVDAAGTDVVEGSVGRGVFTVTAELDPGCSLATTTPNNAVAPVAAKTAQRVMRPMRTLARSRDAGEW